MRGNEIVAGPSTLRDVVLVSCPEQTLHLGNLRTDVKLHHWDDLTANAADPVFEPVPFDHPLRILYFSGTTGRRPKAIVQGPGSILLEHLKTLPPHFGLRGGATRFSDTRQAAG